MNARFKALFTALAPLPPDVSALAVGYSGGLDSTALLHALRDAHPDLPSRAIHVCHHLQPETQAWAAHCANHCNKYDIVFTRLDVQVHTAGKSVEAAARTARYDALAEVLAPGEVLVTAHHLEDQAETFLLQALRGAGVHGLAAMPAHARLGAGGHWRPWLAVARADIRAYARGRELDWIEDPSNSDPGVDRGYLRGAIWPALTERWPAAARTLARSAGWAAQTSEAIDALAALDLQAVATADGGLDLAGLTALSRARFAQVIRRRLAASALDRPDHRHLDQIRALVDAQLRASPCVRFAATEVRLFNGCLYAMHALPALPAGDWPWSGQGALTLPDGAGCLQVAGGGGGAFDLTIRFRAGGERIETAAGAHRALKDVLREARLAPWVRDRIPLIYRGNTLIAIADRWQHPRLQRFLGTEDIRFAWRHQLAGDPDRIVDNEGFG